MHKNQNLRRYRNLIDWQIKSQCRIEFVDENSKFECFEWFKCFEWFDWLNCVERNLRNFCISIEWKAKSKCRIEIIDNRIWFDRIDWCKIWSINKFEIIDDSNLIKRRKTNSLLYVIQIFFESFFCFNEHRK